MYGAGRNEELIGKAIGGRRDQVFLATKFGNVRKPNGEFVGINGSPEYRQGEDVIPIPGTKRLHYLEENIAAVELELADEDVEELDRAFPPNAASGLRYSEAAMKVIDTGR